MPLPLSVFQRYRPISNITPFTYRDGATFLERLERIVAYINSVVEWLNGLDSDHDSLALRVTHLEESLSEAIAANNAATVTAIATLRAELLALIIEANAGGTSFDPTDGTYHKAVGDVMSNVYDFVRVHARFAADYDALDLTATQLDALDEHARHADLSPLDVTNDILL